MTVERIEKNGKFVYRMHVEGMGFSTVFKRVSMNAAMKAYANGELVCWWEALPRTSSSVAEFAQKNTRIGLDRMFGRNTGIYWDKTGRRGWERWWMVEVDPARRIEGDYVAFLRREKEDVRIP